MNTKSARLLLAGALPAIATAIAYVPYFAYRSELPERVATHFDGSGTPDGSATPTTLLWSTTALITIGVAAMVAVALWRRPLSVIVNSVGAFTGAFFAGLGAAILSTTVLTQRGNATWQEAGSPWALVLATVIVALGLGVAALLAASNLETIPNVGPEPSTVPTMSLASGEQAVWSTRLHSRWMFIAGIVLIAAGAVLAISTMWWIMLPSLVAGLAALSLATLHVRADRQGLHVKYSVLPWPSTHIDVADIKTASVIDVRPMQWGGWGYRGSLKLMKQAAVVHRAGPGLRLDLNDGKVFAVTVDHPETPAALLNAEVERAVPAVS